MCGILGLIGVLCVEQLFSGLQQLQNRGYDSAGIGTLSSKKFNVMKYASREETNALDILEKYKGDFTDSELGIAHTRWATHGGKTDINSHPHMSNDEKFMLVHNGIIENFEHLRKFLISNGYKFVSQTDSEVIVNLLSYYYKKTNDVKEAINSTTDDLEGTWALVIICIDTPKKMYCTRHGSPLLVSYNNQYGIVSSEQSGFAGNVSNYFTLENNDICVIEKEKDEINVITSQNYDFKKINELENCITPYPHPHWTIKEIKEQVESSLRAISLGGRLLSNNSVKLGGLDSNSKRLANIDNLILLGCGTSYFAGLLGIQYFKDLSNFNTVQVIDGANFTDLDIPKEGNTALILMSQSGETKDLHRCIEIGKNNNLFLIGLVNVVDSQIAREVNCGCYLNAGREVAVASTKSFTSQVILLSLMALWFAQQKNIKNLVRENYISNLRNLHIDIKKTINHCESQVDQFIPFFVNRNSCFLLGKGKGEAIAREGALKIKEISYIHAEGYSTSSLKHGPFALLNKDFPVILLAPNDNSYYKAENAYQELISRGAKVIFITNKKQDDKENVIYIPNNEKYIDLLMIIPIQILAYKLSIKKNINPDRPRNLAKVVTVE